MLLRALCVFGIAVVSWQGGVCDWYWSVKKIHLSSCDNCARFDTKTRKVKAAPYVNQDGFFRVSHQNKVFDGADDIICITNERLFGEVPTIAFTTEKLPFVKTRLICRLSDLNFWTSRLMLLRGKALNIKTSQALRETLKSVALEISITLYALHAELRNGKCTN